MYKPVTYNDIIKKYGEELTPVEKAINYRFYRDPIYDRKRRIFFHPHGKVIRLCKEQRDTITFDDLKELIIKRMKFVDRNFEMFREKCVYNKTYKEIAQKNHISPTTAQEQIRKITKSIFNEKTLDFDNNFDNIKKLLSDHDLNEIYIKINTNNEVNKNDTSIRNLDISTRTYNCLSCRLEITDLKELEGMMYSELLNCRELGKTTLKEIQSICEKYNINLVNDISCDFDKDEAIRKGQKDRIIALRKENTMLRRRIRTLECKCRIQEEVIRKMKGE